MNSRLLMPFMILVSAQALAIDPEQLLDSNEKWVVLESVVEELEKPLSVYDFVNDSSSLQIERTLSDPRIVQHVENVSIFEAIETGNVAAMLSIVLSTEQKWKKLRTDDFSPLMFVADTEKIHNQKHRELMARLFIFGGGMKVDDRNGQMQRAFDFVILRSDTGLEVL